MTALCFAHSEPYCVLCADLHESRSVDPLATGSGRVPSARPHHFTLSAVPHTPAGFLAAPRCVSAHIFGEG